VLNAKQNAFGIRIDWADLDLFGHVNNVAFFRYIQASRIDYCKSIGLDVLNIDGTGFMVASSSCDFRHVLTYPGEVTIYRRVDWIRNSSFKLAYIIESEGVLRAEARDVLVLFDHRSGTKLNIGAELLKIIELKEGRQIERGY
jgi:acyl-CoA thioester hydrolase